jgi:hypothetical protein
MEFLAMLDDFNNFLGQFFWFKALKFILGFYLIIMVLTIALALTRMIKRYAYLNTLLEGQEFKNIKSGVFQTRWDNVKNLIGTEDPDNWKAAVLESSVMLNEVLEIIGYEGETLGKKISGLTTEQLENLETIKKANEAKNEIVRNGEYRITKEEAEKLVDTFGNALRFFEAVN